MNSTQDEVVGPEAAPPRGRPCEFDSEKVLDDVVELFWEKGYAATSVADVAEATGLSKSSLYNSFGSKDDLFERALRRYVDSRQRAITQVLRDGSQGLDDVADFIGSIRHEIRAGDHRGCLAVNSSTELGLRETSIAAIGTLYRAEMRDGLVSALGRAVDLGEMSEGDVEARANVLLSVMLGLAVIVRSGAPDDEVETHLQAAESVVRSWDGT
jgi:TetR/AcrR family transcriptional repressor of nem operon